MSYNWIEEIKFIVNSYCENNHDVEWADNVQRVFNDIVTKATMYDNIYTTKKLHINDLLKYTKSTMDIDINNSNTTEEYIRKILYAIKAQNTKSVYKRIKRERLRKDIADIDSCFVKADTCLPNESGYNNGYRPNNVVDRHIERLSLREQLGMITIENLLQDQQQSYINAMLEKLIKQLPRRTYDETLELEFIIGLDERDIAIQLGYPTDTIIKRRNAGITALAKLVDNLIKTQKK